MTAAGLQSPFPVYSLLLAYSLVWFVCFLTPYPSLIDTHNKAELEPVKFQSVLRIINQYGKERYHSQL